MWITLSYMFLAKILRYSYLVPKLETKENHHQDDVVDQEGNIFLLRTLKILKNL